MTDSVTDASADATDPLVALAAAIDLGQLVEELLRAVLRTLAAGGVSRPALIVAVAVFVEQQVLASLQQRGRLDLARAFQTSIGNVTHQIVADALDRLLPEN